MLKELVADVTLTPGELAAELGISHSSLRKMRTGDRGVDRALLARLTATLAVHERRIEFWRNALMAHLTGLALDRREHRRPEAKKQGKRT